MEKDRYDYSAVLIDNDYLMLLRHRLYLNGGSTDIYTVVNKVDGTTYSIGEKKLIEFLLGHEQSMPKAYIKKENTNDLRGN